MEHPLPTCDMCGKEIPYETTHVSFIKNTETLHLIDDCIEEVEVIDSELIFILCSACGQNFNTSLIKILIDAIS
jgi:transcription elongation factor Elf1